MELELYNSFEDRMKFHTNNSDFVGYGKKK